MSRRVPHGGPGREWLNEPDDGQAHEDQGAQRNGNGYQGNGYAGHAYPENNGWQDGHPQGNMRRYENSPGYADTQRFDDRQGYARPGQYGGGSGRPGQPPGAGRPARGLPPGRKVRLRRARRFFRRRVVRVISAIVAVFLALMMFSAGQAAFKNNGQGADGEPRRVGPPPLSWPRGDVRRVAVVQPAQVRRQAVHQLRRALGRAAHSGQDAQGRRQGRQEGVRAQHPGHAQAARRGCGTAWRGPVAGGREGEGLPGHPDHAAPRRRPVHLVLERHRLDRPAARQVLAAAGLRGSRRGPGQRRELGRAQLHSARKVQPACSPPSTEASS